MNDERSNPKANGKKENQQDTKLDHTPKRTTFQTPKASKNMQLTLERFAYTDVGTFGRLYLGGLTLWTCEDPWNENAIGRSCIPEGLYTIAPGRYNKGGYDCYDVLDVPGRSLIKIHKGNSDEDTEGCILVGNIFPYWLSDKGLSIGDSAGAFKVLMAALNGGTYQMEIKQYRPVNMDRHRKAA